MNYIYLPLLLLAGIIISPPVMAATESDFILSSDADWIVAGGNAATLTVRLDPMAPGSISLAQVTFSCTDSAFGAPGSFIEYAPFTWTFSSTRSGTAPLKAEILYYENGNASIMEKTFDQKIDHNVPYRIASLNYPFEMPVNGTRNIDVYLSDQYGNLIDSLRETDEGVPGNAETIKFICSPADAGFWDGGAYTTTLNRAVNGEGEVSVAFRASPCVGTNIILIEPPAGIPPRWLSIPGTATLEPCSITASIQPNVDTPPYVRADGTSRFYLTYTLIDRFGNPACNSTVTISTSEPGEQYSSRTNSDGQILITYGPRDRTGIITITARSLVNESVSVSREVEFVSMDAYDMLVTASPQVMASHDVWDTLVSEVRAKVMDLKGNPVENETVTFQIMNCVNDSAQISPPVLQSASAVTGANGYAIVNFIPGTFESDWSKAWYDESASASCDVLAQWDGTTQVVTLEWKNYPYLSVETEVSPESVAVNETVDVAVRLIGSGWALQPDPIDVMLCMDRSGSMLLDYPDRMVATMDAAKIFNERDVPVP